MGRRGISHLYICRGRDTIRVVCVVVNLQPWCGVTEHIIGECSDHFIPYIMIHINLTRARERDSDVRHHANVDTGRARISSPDRV